MLRGIVASLLCVLACLPLNAADNSGNDWVVLQMFGQVQVSQPGVTAIAVKPNVALKGGNVVQTGQDGRAVLVRGEQSIVLRPQTRIVLPVESSDGFTRVQQEFGSALFKVDKKPNAHFEVETPHLAAVVKGTMFDVIVDAVAAVVEVTEGAVEVTAHDGSDPVLARAGERATVDRQPGGKMRLQRMDGVRPARDGLPERAVQLSPYSSTDVASPTISVISVAVTPSSATEASSNSEQGVATEIQQALDTRVIEASLQSATGAAVGNTPSVDAGANEPSSPETSESAGTTPTGGEASGGEASGGDVIGGAEIGDTQDDSSNGNGNGNGNADGDSNEQGNPNTDVAQGPSVEVELPDVVPDTVDPGIIEIGLGVDDEGDEEDDDQEDDDDDSPGNSAVRDRLKLKVK